MNRNRTSRHLLERPPNHSPLCILRSNREVQQAEGISPKQKTEGKTKMKITKILWGVKQGDEDWQEQVLCTQADKFDKVRKLASRDGFNRFRVSHVDDRINPLKMFAASVGKGAAFA